MSIENLEEKEAKESKKSDFSRLYIEYGTKDTYKRLIVERENSPEEDKVPQKTLEEINTSTVDSYITHKFKVVNNFDGHCYEGETMIVDKDNRILIPKNIRDKENIKPGDSIKFRDIDGEFILEKVSDKSGLEEDLKEGYKRNAEKAKEINKEMFSVAKKTLEKK